MKVYIAAPWIRRDDALIAQQQFEAAGHEVVSHWISHHSEAILGDPKDFMELLTQAQEDIADLDRADVLVVLNLELSEGKATELGYAYGRDKSIVVIGELTRNIFYYLPGIVRLRTVEELVRYWGVVSLGLERVPPIATSPP